MTLGVHLYIMTLTTRHTPHERGNKMKTKELKVNYCGRAQQDRMEKNGWTLKIRESVRETPEELYDRLIAQGYTQVKVYWEGTRVKGIHSYFAFVKR